MTTDDLYRWSTPPAEYVIAREGGVEYLRRPDGVYTRQHGGVAHFYCSASRWDASQAARRIRGELGAAHPMAALSEYDPDY